MNKLSQRYLVFAVGLAVNSFGIAFITKSALGTSPISSVPYVLSLAFPGITFGMFTFVLNMGFILLQLLLLRRRFPPVQLLQVAVNVVFSACIDVGMFLLSWFDPASPLLRLASLLLGCAILAAGICIEVAPDVIVVPGEGMVRTIAQVSGREFGAVKVHFDLTLVLIALALSLFFFHTLRGIGLGTLVSAVLVGKFTSLFHRHVPLLDRLRPIHQGA